MATTPATSPLAAAALSLIGPGSSAPELERAFAARGATLRPGTADALLRDLATLGLVRVAGSHTRERRWVLTSLGQQAAEAGLAGGNGTAIHLAELERLRTDLLSTIAHELRTPLTAVRTSVSLLLDRSARATAEQRRTLLETIDRNGERMQRLVGDILDLSRFRSGRIRLQLRPFNATELARDVIASIAPLAKGRGQDLDLVVKGDHHPKVFGDHRRLEQALLNLVSNAHRFSPDGARIEVAVEVADGFVRWSVIDQGPGIPPEDQARLFERFFVGGRGDRNEAREGVGLGLPTALAIAQAHGGTIHVVSRPGHGSTFTLAVPAEGPPEED